MKLRKLTLGTAPCVAAVIAGDLKRESITKALRSGADIFEVRVDTLRAVNIIEVKKAIKRLRSKGAALLLTVRSETEGGRRKLTSKERTTIYDALLTSVDAIDIEISSLTSSMQLKSVVRRARKINKKVILSYHNFDDVPTRARLNELVRRGRKLGAHIVKLAAMPNDAGGLKRLTETLINNKNLIVIAMGDEYKLTRVTFPQLGSLITYGSVKSSTAPGQIKVRDLKKALGK